MLDLDAVVHRMMYAPYSRSHAPSLESFAAYTRDRVVTVFEKEAQNG